MDSGAFTEVARHGGYRRPVEWYFQEVVRWAKCGNLLAAVSQDWMCEGFVLKRTGLSIKEHQRLTVERYDALAHLALCAASPPIMPVLQGFSVSDYLVHVDQYGSRLAPGSWVGVGSVCRNGAPEQVKDILRAVKNKRSDLHLHGFGLKQTALESSDVRDLLYSCDSMAWSYPRRFSRRPGESVRKCVRAAPTDNVQNQPPLEGVTPTFVLPAANHYANTRIISPFHLKFLLFSPRSNEGRNAYARLSDSFLIGFPLVQKQQTFLHS